MITDLRNRLGVDSVEVIECLRWWIKAGLLDPKQWNLSNEERSSDVEVLLVEFQENEIEGSSRD